MKHTPGPWRIVDDCEGPGGYLVSETIDDMSIAEVFKHNSRSEESDKGNAILIAAAPDMEDWIKDTISNLKLCDDEGIFTVIIASGEALLKRIFEGEDAE